MILRKYSPILGTLCLLILAADSRAEPGSAKLGVFSHNGRTHFALSLQGALAADASQRCEVVILVDTSASQAGRYREGELAALHSLLANLKPQDRVLLMAVDAKA